MYLVENQAVVLQQIGIVAGFGQQNAVGHEFDHRAVDGAVVETHFGADRLAVFGSGFRSHAPRQRRGGKTPRLRAADAPGTAQAGGQRHLGQLGGFARTGGPGHNHHRMAADGLGQFFAPRRDRQFFRELPPERLGGGAQRTRRRLAGLAQQQFDRGRSQIRRRSNPVAFIKFAPFALQPDPVGQARVAQQLLQFPARRRKSIPFHVVTHSLVPTAPAISYNLARQRRSDLPFCRKKPFLSAGAGSSPPKIRIMMTIHATFML
ncbi:hypothetical protein SDC9_137128 [bioreactor metagenome]|uniref:Uncharacterized protein n=1 Tax=bioreactor metagenome TaxID=1076179 RepID=A0A645DN97_9ZZZZ